MNFDTFSGKNNIIVNKMGKKEKNKKKGKGAEKTAEKTQKKMKLKIKKATGEVRKIRNVDFFQNYKIQIMIR